MKTIVSLGKVGDSRFKNWAKLLTSVDTSKSNGYCFVGDFIQMGRKHELEIGSHILVYTESGSRKYQTACIMLYRIEPESLQEIYHKDCQISGWALEVRDDIARLINDRGLIN